MEKVEESFFRELERFSMLTVTDKVVVAVSGGPDSMALLHLLARTGHELGVFHLNHQFRKNAWQEALFVEDVVKKLGIVFHGESYDVASYLKRTGESKQQGARHVRYSLLEKLCEEFGYTKVALGHHLDDQAETVFLRLLRGSGLRGLRGMLPVNGNRIRPLLGCTKEEILAFCADWGIPYVEDESNFLLEGVRNTLRQGLLPQIEREYNPDFRRNLARMGEVLRGEEELLQALTNDTLESLLVYEGDQVWLCRKTFLTLHNALQRRVLLAAIERWKKNLRGLEFHHIEGLRNRIQKGGSFAYPLPQVQVLGTRDTIVIGEETPSSLPLEEVEVPLSGRVSLGGLTVFTEIHSTSLEWSGSPYEEAFDLSSLTLPLRLRTLRPLDAMVPFGQKSPKKLNRLLIEKKIPRYLRQRIAVLADERDVLWLVGLRRSSKGRITAGSEQILRVRVTGYHCHFGFPVL